MAEKVLILDGGEPGADALGPARAELLAELGRRGAEVTQVALAQETLVHCQGCFSCWVKTPGMCKSRDHSGPLLQAMLANDTVVLLGPACFGGYGPTVKKLADHWVQFDLPFFVKRDGRMVHPPRYGGLPRLVNVAVAECPVPEEECLLQALVGRCEDGLSAASCSAGIVPAADPGAGIRALLDGSLQAGLPEPVAPAPAATPWREAGPGRALLLVGSPKAGPSTSAVLGGALLDRLEAAGWIGDRLTLNASLRTQAGQDRLFRAVEPADLVLLAFPLYLSSLPHLATLALERLATRDLAGKAFAVVVNSGFPESRQSQLALAICARFAAVAGMVWAGGLVLGAGEALSGGAPLEDRKGGLPVRHVLQGLDLAAAALAQGRSVPAEAQAQLDRSPFPWLPFALWARLFRFLGSQNWKRQAKANGADLQARPLLPALP